MVSSSDGKAPALEAVERAQERWEEERAAADARRRAVVVEAINGGYTMTEIGRVMGLSRARVAQIRDNRR